jgi:hypothetical protein
LRAERKIGIVSGDWLEIHVAKRGVWETTFIFMNVQNHSKRQPNLLEKTQMPNYIIYIDRGYLFSDTNQKEHHPRVASGLTRT